MVVRYKDIADRLEREILKEKSPGDRLPGLRDLARKENISLITARNVYLHLRQKGLISSRQGSGTFVAKAAHDTLIDMATIKSPEELLLWVRGHIARAQTGISAYDPPQGFDLLRDQAGRWLRASGINHRPLVTAGSQQALFLAGFSIIDKGDIVAVEDPGYTGATRIFEALGARIKKVPYIDSPEALDILRDPKIKIFYTMPQGHIPTGFSIPSELRKPLLEIAQRYDFYIIEDDPLSDVLGFTPLKAQDRYDRIIYIKSLSNILGPGLRMGFTVVPKRLYDDIIELKEINDLSISGLLQRLLYEMIKSGDLKRHIVRLKAMIKGRFKYLSKQFGWSTDGPCVWVGTSGPSRIHVDRLMRLNVKVAPGDIYGPRWANHIRISIMSPGREDFYRATEIIYKYLKEESKPNLIDLF